MIINRVGAEYTYDTRTYRIGDRVYANDQSDYEGLYGEIVEICTGDDKGTENEGPDIVCRFDVPVFPEERKKLEKRFSDLYGAPKTIEGLCLDYVIMAAEMLNILYEHRSDACKLPFFFVEEEWVVDGEHGFSREIFTDIHAAEDRLHRKMKADTKDEITEKWTQEADFQCEYQNNYYECWLENSCFENHYWISVSSNSMSLSPMALRIAAEQYTKECHKEDFISHVAQWDGASELTEEQYQQFLANPDIPNLVEGKLNNNDLYWDAFWNNISEVADTLLEQMNGENTP